MRDHVIRGARGQKAQIVAAGGFMVGREPFDLVGVLGADVDLLVAEYQRGARRLSAAGVEYPDLHAEDSCVPLRGARDIADIDHEMIDRIDPERHGLSSSLQRMARARALHFSPGVALVTTRSR